MMTYEQTETIEIENKQLEEEIREKRIEQRKRVTLDQIKLNIKKNLLDYVNMRAYKKLKKEKAWNGVRNEYVRFYSTIFFNLVDLANFDQQNQFNLTDGTENKRNKALTQERLKLAQTNFKEIDDVEMKEGSTVQEEIQQLQTLKNKLLKAIKSNDELSQKHGKFHHPGIWFFGLGKGTFCQSDLTRQLMKSVESIDKGIHYRENVIRKMNPGSFTLAKV